MENGASDHSATRTHPYYMNLSGIRRAIPLLGALVLVIHDAGSAESVSSARDETLALIKPAEPTGTGLLLEPPLDLSKFTTEKFNALSSTVGTNRIHKAWTNPVVPLPAHPRANV